MGIAFEAPLALALLIPALILTIGLHAGARRRMGTGRRRAALILRTVVLTALVLAIAGFQLVLPVDRLATVFVVDLSDSVGNAGRSDALAFLRETLKVKPPGDVAGIVAFGKDALVERLPSELEDIDRIASAPVKSATDIGAALRLATALFPDDAQKRIVLLSDGNDTTGSGQAEGALAASRGVEIETRQIGIGDAEEVLVERLTTPSTARLGESIEAVAEIRSSVAQQAVVFLFADGTEVASQPVKLEEGITRVTFDIKPSEAGFHTFRVRVEAALDTFSENDRADSNTIVKGEPRTLVLAGDDVVAAELVEALESQRQQVDTIVPEALPTDFAGLATYDSVVLVDVPRIRLSDRQLAALQVYVRDLGKGLVMVGGPDSYGAGGYQKTPLEETLPVDMGVRDRQKQPDIALVVVIDASGSMAACHCNTFERGSGSGIGGVQKVDIGKEAILRAAAAMTERDELGVVSFNEAAHWVVRTQPLGGVGDLQGQISRHPGRRPDEHLRGPRPGRAVARGGHGDPPPHHPADRRLVHLGPVRRDPRQDEGRRDHALDGRRGRRRQPVPRAARDQGRRALLRGGQPREHPRHLPQGDPAGVGPADRRGAVLPDPDVLVADHARPRRRPARSSAATTGRPPSRPPRPCS